jgi:hypothetical protein
MCSDPTAGWLQCFSCRQVVKVEAKTDGNKDAMFSNLWHGICWLDYWEDHGACCVVAVGTLIESQPEASASESLHAMQNGLGYPLTDVSGCDKPLNN